MVLVTLLWAPSTLLAQAWYEAYDQAETALAAEDWTGALDHLSRAIEQRPSSGQRVRTYGMRFIDYLPYLRLAQAYFGLGQYEAALEALDTAEGQGAARSTRGGAELVATTRQLVTTELKALEEQRTQRIEQLVAANLDQAVTLRDQERDEDALAALDRVLAVAPDHSQATALRAELLDALGREQQKEQALRVASHEIAVGQQALTSEDWEVAALHFERALEQTPRSAAAAAGLVKARSSLKRQLREQSTSRHGLERSLRALEARLDAGDIDGANVELQRAMAIAPEDEQVLALGRRLAIRDSEIRSREASERSWDAELDEADRLLDSGRAGRALRITNRVLIERPQHSRALNIAARGYTQLSRALLDDDGIGPVIVLDDSRFGSDESSSAERIERRRVRAPELQLSGSVFDKSPVELELRATSGPLPVEVVTDSRELEGLWITDFRFELALPAGTTTYELTAIDASGLVTGLPLELTYDVPFVRTIWPPMIGLLLVIALVLGLATQRRRRRSALLRERFNPYVAGAPILEQGRFFGRQQLLEYVLRRICNNSVMLYGERRIGKTSFQHQLKRRLLELDDPDYEFFPVFVDLQGVPQEKFFFTLASDIFHELSPRLEGLQPKTPLVESSYAYRDLVRDLQRVLSALAHRTRKRVKLVLLIDEVDELNDYDPRINQRLRSLFMRAFAENLTSVVSGVTIKKQWEREGSPWYNFFQEIEVQPLDRDEARRLIEKPVSGVFDFERGVSDEIIDRTNSKPYLIQRLCAGLVERLHNEGRQTITTRDVDGACQTEGLL